MMKCRGTRMVLLCLSALLVLTPACKDDEVVATYTCGDGVCNGEEDESNCLEDCPAACGNGECGSDETVESCPEDCDMSCGDGWCLFDETAADCPEDCGTSCGDGKCRPSETGAACPADCAVSCGDGSCGLDETAVSCPGDCAGPLYPGPSTGDARAASNGLANHDEVYKYEMVGENLRVTVLEYNAEASLDDRVTYHLFNPDGDQIRMEGDLKNDGEIDAVYQWEYDAQGRLTYWEWTWPDPVAHHATTYSYDATGYLAYSYTEDFIEGGHDTEINYEWNADHTFRTEHVDTHVDGTINWVNELTFDATGTVIHRWDGEYERDCDFFYDQENLHAVPFLAPWLINSSQDIQPRHLRLLELYCTFDQWDEDWWTRFHYDEYGNLLSKENAHDPLPLEFKWFIEYSYDCWE